MTDEFDDEFDESFAGEAPPARSGEAIRLQKVLASAGLGSRRACEELISEGRVEVDGRIVTELGTRVDPDSAIIRVDGSRLPTRAGMTYLVLNKPRGVVSTMSDPEGRPCVGDYVKDRKERLFHVGRLDTDTEGLILLTNDGELANRLSHPRYGVSKIYFADVAGPLPRDLSRTLKAGVQLEDGVARADKFRQIGVAGGRAQVEVEIHEGRNHIVRRMLEAAGHPVSRLVRVQIGPVNMGNLPPGRMRHLTTHEVGALLTASESDAPPRRRTAAPAKRTGKKPDPARKNVGSPAARKANAAKKAAARPAPSRDDDRPRRGSTFSAKKAGAKKPGAERAGAERRGTERAGAERPGAKKAPGKFAGKKTAAPKAAAPKATAPKATGKNAPGKFATKNTAARDTAAKRTAGKKTAAPARRPRG